MKEIQVKELRYREELPSFAPEKPRFRGHHFEAIVRDGRTVCIVIPSPVPKPKMDIIFSLMPEGTRLSIDLSNRWGVWGVICTSDYRAPLKLPEGYILTIP